ncbi:MAG: PEPxxWA-CTERM sorting domain-containing protein [Phenylobacterium sp.]|nr:PEPxxWA-CTERM sorting domain-containing protein [Phenylobacterium sp.]
MKKLLLAAVASIGLAGAANAAVIPVLTDVSADGDLFRFTYEATLSADAGVMQGSKLVIYDFAGFAGGFETPNPFIEASTELVTAIAPAPGGVLPALPNDDNPLVENLVFTWTGPDFQTDDGPYTNINFILSVLSEYSDIRTDGFSAVTVKNNGAQQGSPLYNVGSTSVPMAGAIPEPGTWAMMIIGFGGVGALMRRRRGVLPIAA